MKSITDLYLDMDGTLIDFDRGNLERAKSLMKYPVYYKDLPLKEEVEGRLKLLRALGIRIHIISGIADKEAFPNYIDMDEETYKRYYEEVAQIKSTELKKKFSDGIIDEVYFLRQSFSKAKLIKEIKGDLTHSLLIDDYHRYCEEWIEEGGVSFQVTEDCPLGEILDLIIRDLQVKDLTYDNMMDVVFSAGEELQAIYPDHIGVKPSIDLVIDYVVTMLVRAFKKEDKDANY